MRKTFILLVFVVGTFQMFSPQLSFAQEPRDTGRHKPKPVIKKEMAKVQDVGTRNPGSFHLGLQVGFTKGSGLFDASTLSANSVPWETLGGGSFNSQRFSTKLHHNLVAGILGRYVYSPGRYTGAAIRFGVDFSEVEVLAQALAGQVGNLVLYDRVSIVNLGLGWEFPLADLASYPYAGAEVLAEFFSPSMAIDLQQTNIGGRVVFGYHFQFHQDLGFRIEGRISRTVWGGDDFLPESTLDNQPPMEYSSAGHVTIFDVLVGVDLKM